MGIVAYCEKGLYAITGTKSRELGTYCGGVRKYGNDKDAKPALDRNRYHALNLTNLAKACGRSKSVSSARMWLSTGAFSWPHVPVDIDKENTMKINGKRAKTVAGKRYTDYIQLDLAVLASARRWLNANGMCEQSQFTPEESDRRVAFYAEQIAAQGQITRWLPAAQPRPKARYRTRFAFGDALGTHMTARSA